MPREYIPSSEWGKPRKTQDGKIYERIFSVLFIASMCLLIVSLYIYEATFIPWYKLIIPTLLGSTIFTVVFFKTIKTNMRRPWLNLIVCMLVGGAYAHFGFMYLNKALAEEQTYQTTLPIIHTGSFAHGTSRSRTEGGGNVTVEFNGQEKQVPMNWENDQNISYSKLYIEYSMGKLGYYVIRKKQLVE